MFPKICIVLNNWSREGGIQGQKKDSDDSSDPDEEKVTFDDQVE